MHAMTARVDTGPLVDVVRFTIPANMHVEGLEGLAYANLAQLYWRRAKQLATDSDPLPVGTLRWGAKKNSRRAYQAICDIPLDISREELEHRLKIFGGNHFGVAPTIHLHGVEFRAVV
jgi:hypothetical protein